MMVHPLVMFLLTLFFFRQFRKLLMYAPLEEQPKQSLSREEMTEVGAQSQQSSDAAQHQTWIHLYISIATAGANHLWPLLRPGVHQSVHWVSFSRRPQRQRQIQPTQVLFVQGEICWSRCADAENASSRGKKNSLSSSFQGLFRNFADAFIPLLRPHMERLVADTHESKQRCVSEIISGLIRGCKHWDYLKACVNLSDMRNTLKLCFFLLDYSATKQFPHFFLQVEGLWQLLCPLLRTALSNITIETYADWGTCIATACVSLFSNLPVFPFSCLPDNTRPHFYVTLCCSGEPGPTQAALAVWDADGVSSQWRGGLFCWCLVSKKKKKGSCHKQVFLWAATRESWAYFFFFCSRLYVLQGGLAQQEWRVPELLHRLLQYLEPKLTQVYKNVRERIGRWGSFHTSGINQKKTTEALFVLLYSVLTYIFMIDVNLPYTQPTTSPRISDFTERILLQLKPLTEGDEEIQNHVIEENEVEEQDERTQAIKLFKTGASKVWHVIGAVGMTFGSCV